MNKVHRQRRVPPWLYIKINEDNLAKTSRKKYKSTMYRLPFYRRLKWNVGD